MINRGEGKIYEDIDKFKEENRKLRKKIRQLKNWLHGSKEFHKGHVKKLRRKNVTEEIETRIDFTSICNEESA